MRDMRYTLGSLFDGSGGFPLAGALCGIEPKWAAEVEPYPIAVTRSRFPSMRHLGDISKVDGAEIEPVDIITFGSPCQDLSVAGKRAGLKHEANGDDETTRSGLFMEAVRIIKEMREATNGEYPAFALWENVPGAFSSNKGEDFRIVCEELIKIVEPGASMPPVPSNGWAYADSFCGDGWSLAYRVFDAQYWGVPQRRRRIHLVLDLRGQRAREVLFERQGVRWYFAEGRTPWQAITGNASESIGTDDREGEGQGGTGGRGLDAIAYSIQDRAGKPGGGKGFLVQENLETSLRTSNYQYIFQPTAYSFDSLASNSMKSSNPHSGCRQVEIAKTLDTTDQNPCKNQGGIDVVQPVSGILLDDQGGQKISVRTDDKVPTLRAEAHGNVPAVVCIKSGGFCPEPSAKSRGIGWEEENAPTLRASVTPAIVCKTESTIGLNGGKISPTLISRMEAATGTTQDNPIVCQEEVSPTLLARQYKDPHLVTYPEKVRYIVRRLTPTECARLQGFADRWGDIEPKTTFSTEEYEFWLDVRNTHAEINGKPVREYTEAQMLAWYNKLHTDSAEYKMWGNGIALPPALYCMQGLVDVLDAYADIEDLRIEIEQEG